jgi:hypothetical protein
MLKCQDQFFDAIDEMQLRAAAIKVLPKSVRVVVGSACRNPTWARAFIETQNNLTSDGIQQWHEFVCTRNAQPWKCDPPEFKNRISRMAASAPAFLSDELLLLLRVARYLPVIAEHAIPLEV